MPRRLIRRFARQPGRLLAIKDTPHAIGVGVAAGIFMGFTPLFGLKTVLALLIAFALRGNKLAALIAVSLHDILLPLFPMILLWEFRIGRWLLHIESDTPEKLFSLRHLRFAEHFNWTTFFEAGWPLLLGSLVFSLPFALGSYGLTRFLVERIQRRQMIHAAALEAHAPSGGLPPVPRN